MKRWSVIFLVIANVFPLIGVLFFGWSLFAIIFLYWFENIVIGLYNIVRMNKATGGGPNKKYEMTVNGQPRMMGKASFSGFFAMHYGIFTFVHGVFVFTLFGPPDISLYYVGAAVLFLFISHGASYYFNFIKKEEYKRVTAEDLSWQPYLRILVIHITIIFGGMLINFIGAPAAALVVMIIMKTFMDGIAHVIEHKKFGRLKGIV